MRLGDDSVIGRMATRMALIPVGGFRHRYPLASLYPHGFTAPDAEIRDSGLLRGEHVYIGSRVTFYRQKDGGEITLENGVFLNEGVRFETGFGGAIAIGSGTHIQPECQFSAYAGNIRVGRNVQIAPRCAFYPYNHGVVRSMSIMDQPLVSRGGILVKDDAWIGYGTIVLDGVTIGVGAVVGAGSVVKNDIPDYAISAGIPASVIRMRE